MNSPRSFSSLASGTTAAQLLGYLGILVGQCGDGRPVRELFFGGWHDGVVGNPAVGHLHLLRFSLYDPRSPPRILAVRNDMMRGKAHEIHVVELGFR